jgi:sRNA-binding regulator protein Hfq
MNNQQETRHINSLITAKIPVEIRTVDGHIFMGTIEWQEDQTLLLRSPKERYILIYKQNIVDIEARALPVPIEEVHEDA